MLHTFGHGTLESERFSDLLVAAGIRHLVDVRRFPASRHNPQFHQAAIEAWLPTRGISYRWEAALGGFRKPANDSPNTGLHNASFRGYADHMATPAFRVALDRLLSEATDVPTAVMCSEALWWRCHRRLVADAATMVAGVRAAHLMHDGTVRPHVVTDRARVDGGTVTYPPEL
jgi:uncharacterized protein (DUF488 family)